LLTEEVVNQSLIERRKAKQSEIMKGNARKYEKKAEVGAGLPNEAY